MRIAAMNWNGVSERAALDDRCVLPIGSVEQHAHLSLATDAVLAEKVAIEAAEPLGVPVFPVLPYGLAAGFVDYPGTVSLRLSTYCALIEDLLEGLHRSGFRRITLVNGHGGNSPVATIAAEWLDRRRGSRVKLHDWWRAPATWAKVMAIDPAASHASWMENFPWTRVAGVVQPTERKPEIDRVALAMSDPGERRRLIGDGNYHGLYQRDDAEMAAIWAVAVEETRAAIEGPWA
ncbi:creatininase family protein [Siculibacillus lacustris]|uniref:Creatininase family protein n=1 Tax=Siculibacillus lacustris TaxID=1549641 RepID=A0A4Q9VXI2_9HYPH|nr:creatininase family protein [Siculibacillus lacustris]TBW41187.1 creatininase family protein [Siculibacillus lacustris]